MFVVLWLLCRDARNFHCEQVLHSNVGAINSFEHSGDPYKRLFVGSRQFEIKTFQQDGSSLINNNTAISSSASPSSQLSALSHQIVTVLYSSVQYQFIVVTASEVKLFNALTGELSRIYRGLTPTNTVITTATIDQQSRKLMIGDSLGAIRSYSYRTGAYMKSFTPHSSGEAVESLLFCDIRRLLISISSGGEIMIHDEKTIEEQITLFRGHINDELIYSHSKAEILAAAINTSSNYSSAEFHSFVLALSNSNLIQWNIEHQFRDSTRAAVTCNTVTQLIYLGPHPLLASSDVEGNIIITYSRPHPAKLTQAAKFHLIGHHIHANECINDIAYDEEHQQLFCATEKGEIFRFSLAQLIQLLMVPSRDEDSIASCIQALRYDYRVPVTHPTHKNKVGLSVLSISLIDNPYSVIVQTADHNFIPLYCAVNGQFLSVISVNSSFSSPSPWNYAIDVTHSVAAYNSHLQTIINQMDTYLKQNNFKEKKVAAHKQHKLKANSCTSLPSLERKSSRILSSAHNNVAHVSAMNLGNVSHFSSSQRLAANRLQAVLDRL
jgi:hypothetical protein